MELVERIQSNLRTVRATLWHSIGQLLQRGETAERIEMVAIEVAKSSKAFDVATEKRTASPWQRCCGRGRWIHWLVPCIPLWQWCWRQGSKDGQ